MRLNSLLLSLGACMVILACAFIGLSFGVMSPESRANLDEFDKELSRLFERHQGGVVPSSELDRLYATRGEPDTETPDLGVLLSYSLENYLVFVALAVIIYWFLVSKAVVDTLPFLVLALIAALMANGLWYVPMILGTASVLGATIKQAFRATGYLSRQGAG